MPIATITLSLKTGDKPFRRSIEALPGGGPGLDGRSKQIMLNVFHTHKTQLKGLNHVIPDDRPNPH
jgi:hypothetical protein